MTTEAEVHVACDTLNARGEEPKYDKIRQELGNKGSWSTIKRFRDTWLAREAEVPPVPEALTSYVAAISKAIWHEAYPAAAATFGEERRRQRGEIEDLRAAESHAEADRAARDSTMADLTATVADLRARLATARDRHREQADHCVRLSGEVGVLTRVNAELQAKLTARPDAPPALRVVTSEAGHEGHAS